LPKKHDQVFQLTLTELAFMLIFLIMLIMGWMILDGERQGRETASRLRDADRRVKLAGSQTPDSASLAMLKAMKANGIRPDEVMARLRTCQSVEARAGELGAHVADQDKQIASLAAFQDRMKELSGQALAPAIVSELATAMAFKKGYEEASGMRLDDRTATKRAWDCVAAQAKSDAMASERQNLINQVTFMRHQLEGLNGNKGIGPPPCWVDNTGRVQRLLAVEVTEQGLLVRPGWPPERDADAKKLPNIDALVGRAAQSPATFHAAAAPLLEWSRTRSPECRHYASVTVSATRVNTSVAGQNAVFDHFFPYGKVTLVPSGH
jgi:hypothetical protein